MDKDKINLLNRIVKKQDELIDSFTDWVKLVKADDLEGASEVVKVSNKLRLEITELKKQLEKLNRKSGIILLNGN
jgi:hypothetical protein